MDVTLSLCFSVSSVLLANTSCKEFLERGLHHIRWWCFSPRLAFPWVKGWKVKRNLLDDDHHHHEQKSPTRLQRHKKRKTLCCCKRKKNKKRGFISLSLLSLEGWVSLSRWGVLVLHSYLSWCCAHLFFFLSRRETRLGFVSLPFRSKKATSKKVNEQWKPRSERDSWSKWTCSLWSKDRNHESRRTFSWEPFFQYFVVFLCNF